MRSNCHWYFKNKLYDSLNEEKVCTANRIATYKETTFKLLESKMNDMMIQYENFTRTHGIDYTTIPNTAQSYNVYVLGTVTVMSCQSGIQPNVTSEQYYDIINNFFNAFDAFVKYVQAMRTEVDTQTF